MRAASLTSLLTAALVLLPVSCLLAEEPPGIQHDPFSRPPLRAAGRGVEAGDNADASPVGPDLRITLVSNGKRLANVGGRIIGIGEQLDGYTLVAVHEDRAEFVWRDRHVTVYVKPELVEDDELLDD